MMTMKVNSVINTLMLPSDDPLMKQSSVGSTASALSEESWAWKLWRWCLWGSSRMLIQPFLPPVISSCCLGAIASTVAPDSWQQKAGERERRWGRMGTLERTIGRSIKDGNKTEGQRGEWVIPKASFDVIDSQFSKHQLIIWWVKTFTIIEDEEKQQIFTFQIFA